MLLACGGGGGGSHASPPPGGGGGGTFSGSRGVFALQKEGQPIPSAVYADPNVDGIAIRARWSDVEPSEGNFDFSLLDGQIAAANSTSKSVSISLVAGIYSPSWVYAAGASSFSTIVDQKYTQAFCQPAQVPIPWDPVFLQKWTALIQAVGQHYANTPALGRMHITGINFHNEETSLPAQQGGTVVGLNGQVCQTNNDVQEWMSVGYTAVLVKNAFSQIADAFSASFPKIKIAPMVHGGGFPPLNDTGQVDSAGAQLQGQLISLGVGRYGQQFGVQNNSLSASFVDPQVAAVAATTTTGYQMLWFVTNDNTCRMNHFVAPCDPRTDLQGAINLAVQSGGTYLEIYLPDILNPALADIIASAHTQLVH
jgi:hypothetical protein